MTGNEDLANEAIQVLFVKIWEKRSTLNSVQAVKSYLLRSYRRTVLDLIQIEKQQNKLSFPSSPFQISPEELLLFEQTKVEQAQQLADLLNRLPAKQKEIIYLRFYNQLSYLEIAEIIDLNYQSVRNYGVKAIQFLRENWKK